MSDLYKKGRKTRFGNNLVIPESFNECLTYGEQLIWIFLHKQNTLVEGDNITLTRNADGTYTISSEAAGSTYEMVETTPSAGNVKAYKLVDVATGEQAGDTIEIPEASSFPQGMVGSILQKTGSEQDDVSWVPFSSLYPKIERAGSIDMYVDRTKLSDQAFGYTYDIDAIDHGVYEITITNTSEYSNYVFFNWIAKFDGYGDLSVSAQATGVSEFGSYSANFVDRNDNFYPWLSMDISSELDPGETCVLTVTVTANDMMSWFSGILDFEYTYSPTPLSVTLAQYAVEAGNGLPSGGIKGYLPVKTEDSAEWVDFKSLYPKVVPDDLGESRWLDRMDISDTLPEGVTGQIYRYGSSGTAYMVELQNTNDEATEVIFDWTLACSGYGDLSLSVRGLYSPTPQVSGDFIKDDQDNYAWIHATYSNTIPARAGSGMMIEITVNDQNSYFNDITDLIHTYSRQDIISQNGIPAGGSAGQVLQKSSGNDYDVEWATPSGGGLTKAKLEFFGLYVKDYPTRYHTNVSTVSTVTLVTNAMSYYATSDVFDNSDTANSYCGDGCNFHYDGVATFSAARTSLPDITIQHNQKGQGLKIYGDSSLLPSGSLSNALNDFVYVVKTAKFKDTTNGNEYFATVYPSFTYYSPTSSYSNADLMKISQAFGTPITDGNGAVVANIPAGTYHVVID